MRICFFNRSYYPDLGATGQLLTELAEGLARTDKCEVSVVAGPPLNKTDQIRVHLSPIRRESHNNVQVFRASGTWFRPRFFAARAVNYLTYFLSACLAGLRIPRPDVVVSMTDPPIIGLAALLAARGSGAKFVFICQDIFPEVAKLLDDFQNELVNRLLDRITRFLIKKADRVVTLGETMRERLVVEKGADPQRVTVIHNWADCSEIKPGPKRNSFSMEHGLAGKFVVMHSGNMGLSQGLESLVEAASHLSGISQIQFVFVGDGVKRPALEARVRDLGLKNVRFLPYQPKERLTESFAGADLFVISLKRGLAGYIVPSKLYGILAAGRPYVAAVEEACEVAAITKKCDCGLLARPDDPDDLAAKILRLYHDRALRERLGANARQAAFVFDRSVQVRAYHDLFQALSLDRLSASKHGPLLLKRAFDLFLSGLGLLVSMPLWALFALLIWLEDRAPVFFRDVRVGQGGRRFNALKFRTMIPNADAKFGLLQACENDPRVTRVGKLLRATAMDELPQLWNIFIGEMSFVGPRALRPQEIEVRSSGPGAMSADEIPNFHLRHRIRPGLTGLAQIYAPRDATRRQKLRFDLLYVRCRSLWLDLKLIALSFWITFRGKWESREKKI